MAKIKLKKLNKNDWLVAALKLLRTSGIDAVRVVVLAQKLGVTSGSFYWHFPNRAALHDALLDYWEREMTDKAIEAAKAYQGLPEERIWQIMEQVMRSGLAKYDLAVWHWSKSDPRAQKVFARTMEKRFSFATWMFEQVGFDPVQARVRARMMVVYMMGESTLLPEEISDKEELLRLKYELLVKK